MIVWTYHSSTFPLDSPDLVIDYTKGQFWNSELTEVREGYRAALPKLHELLNGETQFLWCHTRPGRRERLTIEQDVVEWEMNVPDSQVLSLYDEAMWEDILYKAAEVSSSLLTSDLNRTGEPGVGAFVRVPIKSEWATRKEMTPKYPRRWF